MTCRRVLAVVVVALLFGSRVFAQEAPAAEHEHHQMSMMESPLGIGESRDGSGTSWLPDESAMHSVMWHRGPWMLMVHGNGFAQFIKTGTDRGDEQAGSINWIMGMAQRGAAGGTLTLRSMLSAEPLTVGRCGYPTLLQSGESCRGAALHDRQHPHDLFMEVAADYRRALNDAVAIEVYGGLAGEPALGPVAYPHRLSAMPNPIAPASHHWADSSHITFGVVTGGVYGRRWKAETSIFNGREPDDSRYGFDLAALDSYSGRLWWLPSSRWALQMSAGHLHDAERDAAGESADLDRVTASATYHRFVGGRMWATTIIWGRNSETAHHGTTSTEALNVETAADLSGRDTLFARGEVIGKTAAELALPIDDHEAQFTVGKFQVGYTRWFTEAARLRFGLGGSAGLSLLPDSLKPFYGSRTGGEFAVFLNVRPR
jgi:hypothetical protein